jgi:membrane protein DedA with SNARE-associated domain
LVSVYGLNTAIGIFAGFLLASFLLFFLQDSEPSSLLIFFLLLALLLTPKLSPLSFQLKRLHKFYITLGAVPISILILYLLYRREERGR